MSVPQRFRDTLGYHVQLLLDAAARLKELDSSFPHVNEHLNKQIRSMYEDQGQNACDVQRLLQSPKKQLEEYIHLLSEISTHTHRGHPDYAATADALRMFQSICSSAGGTMATTTNANAPDGATATAKQQNGSASSKASAAPDLNLLKQNRKMHQLEAQLATLLATNKKLEAAVARRQVQQEENSAALAAAERRAEAADLGRKTALDEVNKLHQQLSAETKPSRRSTLDGDDDNGSDDGDEDEDDSSLAAENAELKRQILGRDEQVAAAEASIARQRQEVEAARSQLEVRAEPPPNCNHLCTDHLCTNPAV